MEHIEPHVLFNMINNLFPLLLLDTRPLADFSLCHLKGSRNEAPGHTTMIEWLDGWVTDSNYWNKKEFIVLLLDQKDLASTVNSLSDLTKTEDGMLVPPGGKPWDRILGVRCVVFEDFRARYGSCAAIMVYETPDAPQYPCRLPYASEILPSFLFLGDWESGSNKNHLLSLGITHVVDASGARLSQHTAASELKIEYLAVNVWDTEEEDIAAHFDTTTAFIATARQSGGRVLVHCRAGISRSPSLVMAYMMAAGVSHPDEAKFDLRGALRHVVTQRPVVCPNEGFRDQLRLYEERLLGRASIAHDEEFMEVVASVNVMWSGNATGETDFDRMPLPAQVGANKGSLAIHAFLEGAEPPPAGVDPAVTRPPRPFLKRGAKTVAKK